MDDQKTVEVRCTDCKNKTIKVDLYLKGNIAAQIEETLSNVGWDIADDVCPECIAWGEHNTPAVPARSHGC